MPALRFLRLHLPPLSLLPLRSPALRSPSLYSPSPRFLDSHLACAKTVASRRDATFAQEMIDVKNLSKSYGSVTAVSGVSFQAKTGQATGFLGPNGAGNTTTMRIITGFMPATEGTVTVDGFDVFDDSFEVRRRIGYLPETPPLYLEMKVDRYLQHVAKLKGVARKQIRQATERVVSECGLEAVAGRLCGHLSKGYRQRVGLAQALIHEPAVLILDEPTIGLDPAQIIEIRELIKGLTAERTVILSTHILPEVAQICQRVVIINEGRVALETDIADLTSHGSLEQEYLRHVGRDSAQSRGVTGGSGRTSATAAGNAGEGKAVDRARDERGSADA